MPPILHHLASRDKQNCGNRDYECQQAVGRSHLGFFVDELVPFLLKQMHGFHDVFLHQENEDARKGRHTTHGNVCFRQGLGDRGKKTDVSWNISVAEDLHASPTGFLLNIVGSHELGADDRKLVIRAECEAHIAFCKDDGDFTKLGKFADAELLFQHQDLELFVHSHVFRLNGGWLRWLRQQWDGNRVKCSISLVSTQAHVPVDCFFVIGATRFRDYFLYLECLKIQIINGLMLL